MSAVQGIYTDEQMVMFQSLLDQGVILRDRVPTRPPQLAKDRPRMWVPLTDKRLAMIMDWANRGCPEHPIEMGIDVKVTVPMLVGEIAGWRFRHLDETPPASFPEAAKAVPLVAVGAFSGPSRRVSGRFPSDGSSVVV